MDINHRQKADVLFGNSLHNSPQIISPREPICLLSNKEGASIPLDEDLLSKHIMLLGAIGTGKTNTFFQVISQISAKMNQNDVMVIFDTKGDFYKEFYRPGDVVISNDNTATGGSGVDYWNIFEEIDRDEHLYENIIEISRSIFTDACENTNQPFFPNAARDIFMATLYHFVKTVEPQKCTNQNLLAFINSATTKDLRDMLCKYDLFRAMSSYISIDDSPQTQGVLSELQQVCREVFLGNFAKHGDIGVRKLIRAKGGTRIFIEYDLGLGNLLSPIYSLLFDFAIKEALSRSRSEGNVYFITDEFKLLPHLQHIDDAVNFGRSLGTKFMVGVQNVEQLYANYGEERARSILSGFSTNICFRVNDAKSREYIQGLFGKNQKLEAYMPSLQSKGLIETQREGNVVEDWDITGLRIGEAIVGLPGEEPFVFRFDEYK